VLEEAAARAGTSIEAASAGIQKFAARIDDARSGTGAAAEAFRELGISQEELANTAPTELAARVAEELGKIEDPARRAALQVDLLGKSGEELRRTFSEIPGAADDLEKFGAAISPEDRARIEALGPAFDGFGVALRGLGQSVITPFAGIVAGLTETLGSLINVVTAVAQAIGAVLSPVLDGVGAAFGLFADGINNTVGFFRSFFASTDEAAEKVETLKAAAEEATEFDDAAAKAFQKTLEGVQQTLSDAVDESSKFGEAGFNAALQYQNSITELQRQFDQGIINEESFKRAAEQANEAYEQQIDTIRRATEETERKAQAEADAVQSIIDANLEQIRVDQQFGGDSSRAKAADNLLKIQQEQLRVEEQLQAARAAGDAEAINALSGRLATLDQVAARERDIASGAAKQREEAAKAAEDAAKEVAKIAEQRAKDLERVNEQILDKQKEFAARQFEIELERAQELATVRTGSVEINDIRSGGISAFFDTLTEDPAIAEAKKTNKELEQIRKGISALQAEKIDILGGTG
jgi:chemotaxis protein histidine kinase CheA